MHIAARFAQLPEMLDLISQGADPYILNKAGLSPIHILLQGAGLTKILRITEKYPLDFNSLNDAQGRSFAYYIAEQIAAKKQQQANIARACIVISKNQISDTNNFNAEEKISLLPRVDQEIFELEEFVRKERLELNKLNFKGQTALDEFGDKFYGKLSPQLYVSIRQTLCRLGFRISGKRQVYIEPPAFTAVKQGDYARALVESIVSSNPNQQDSQGRSIAHHIYDHLKAGRGPIPIELLRLLNLELLDFASNETLIEQAAQEGRLDLVQLLFEAGAFMGPKCFAFLGTHHLDESFMNWLLLHSEIPFPA